MSGFESPVVSMSEESTRPMYIVILIVLAVVMVILVMYMNLNFDRQTRLKYPHCNETDPLRCYLNDTYRYDPIEGLCGILGCDCDG